MLAAREPAAVFMSLIPPLAIFLALGFSVGDIEIEITSDSGNAGLFHVRDVLLAAFGIAVASRVRNVRAALGLVLFFPMMVLSGAFGPREDFPAALQALGDWLPLTRSYDLLTCLWLGAAWEVETTTGVPVWASFAYLAGIAAVSAAASARLFRWD